jgi:Zn-finger nucleic acid-binding protein
MAKCPACKNVVLELSILDNALPVLTCSVCGGSWLRANEYAIWLKSQKPGYFDEARIKEASQRFPVVESNKAVVCPDCGHFLRKFKIGAKIDFHLNHCHHCNGVWLDKNEWESLKMADLHDEINQFFTEPWQRDIQNKITASKFDALYLERFGESDYQKIKEIRAWLQENPNQNNLIAFLLDKDPFST